jgi:hypothetical protein
MHSVVNNFNLFFQKHKIHSCLRRKLIGQKLYERVKTQQKATKVKISKKSTSKYLFSLKLHNVDK